MVHISTSMLTATAVSAGTTAVVRLGDALVATGDPEPTSVLTQAGVFTVALGIAYWLLRRSDDREAAASAAAKIERDLLQKHLDEERAAHLATAKELATASKELIAALAALQEQNRRGL